MSSSASITVGFVPWARQGPSLPSPAPVTTCEGTVGTTLKVLSMELKGLVAGLFR